ncbi:uncharacterized protein FOMMEDRAFT_151255 [Fomitiporia mediterranea MF3/22]|uniref:uncharacterized protein n=1 Tax=Fomitiporia mediterranea (strain MF3/22) TaxID=694068 RepID=UPI0004409BAF|nr:uncharacterized protein FOMMEDRAFT_151255 [Fomitiporia mediterranea MF3/22]EJD08401.1 hypothetical protein FOMMEDRAFT_151255 [Fomitiporia mediterranea MF3/22]
MPPTRNSRANKENEPITRPTVRQKAKWTLMDDTKLVECLEYQKSIGNQSDSGFKSITWTYAASELNKVVVEGGEKSASGVKDHWQQVDMLQLIGFFTKPLVLGGILLVILLLQMMMYGPDL